MNKPNFQPLRDRVLVKQDEANERHGEKSLLYKPETTQEKPPRGTVVAIGDGRVAGHGEIVPLAVRVGDYVHFKRHAMLPMNIPVSGILEEFVIVREDDILGIEPAR
jgi:chaperonin GroES